MKSIIIVAHPNWEHSKHTKALVEQTVAKASSQVDIRILDTKGNFNVEEEQAVMLQYDNIIYAFPFWWYSMPWTLKKYMDDVFTSGFAYSFRWEVEDFKLRGKKFSYLVSVGNTLDTYQEGADNRHEIPHFLDSLNATFNLASTTANVGGVNLPDSASMLNPGIAYGAAVSAHDSDAEIDSVTTEFAKQL